MSWDSCDIDGPEFYNEEERVSRKERQCIECCAPILPGERYLSCRGKWDDNFSVFGQHLLCRDACVWVRDVLNGECIPFGELSGFWDDTRRPCEIQGYFARYSGQGRVETTPERRRIIEANWLIGARMFAMVRRRERLARVEVSP